MNWTDEEAKTALRLRYEGLTFKEIAAAMGGGLTKNKVQARIYRLTGRAKLNGYVRPKTSRAIKTNPTGNWDAKLIEPWVEYAARRRAERAQMQA